MSTTRPGAPVSLEATRVDGYLIFLFVLLSTATLFDGFDAAMLTIAAPDVRETLGIQIGDWGYLFAFTRLGMIASFVLLLFADRVGRRALMMVTIVGFAITNGLSGFATTQTEFAVLQMLARIFLTAEYALAVIMVGEEFPARLRGRAIAILTSFATLGVMFIARLQPFILLHECAPDAALAGTCVPPESNWLRDFGMAVVATVQEWMGRPVDGADWRVLYVLGLAPLALVLVLRLSMRETRRFEAVRLKRDAGSAPAAGWRHQLANAGIPWQPEYRRRTLMVVLLWNCVHLVTAPSIAYWVIFAREQLEFTPALVGSIIFWGYAGGVAGNYAAGFLIDRIGRRITCALLYTFAAISICMLYQVHTVTGQYGWMIATVFGFGAATTATHVYATELFPTEIRATGYGWTTNLFGRITEFATPALIGFLIARFEVTLSMAVAFVALGPVIGSILVLRYAPETRGLTLEAVQTQAR
jgi:MFS transporter, putative metabolite:H+ symporter